MTTDQEEARWHIEPYDPETDEAPAGEEDHCDGSGEEVTNDG